LAEVIKISKDSNLVKSYNNNDQTRMAGMIELKDTFWLGSVTLLYAQKKLGFVSHENNDMPFRPLKYVLILLSLIIRNTVGVYVFDTVLMKYPHMTSHLVGMREAKEMFFNYSETGSFINSPTQIG